MYGDGLTAKGHPLEEALRKKLEELKPFELDLNVKDRKPDVVPKVGDKVRIKSRAWYDKWKTIFGIVDVECDFIGYMAKYCGRIMTVRNVRDGVFKLDEDSASYNWSLEMFEEVYQQIKLEPGMLTYKDADPYRPLTAVEAAENFRSSKLGKLVCKIDASSHQQIIEQFLAFPVGMEEQEPELETIKRHRFIKLKKD